MERPSAMASTMVEKLSSASTMSDASLATAVPVMPMAMPMSASLSAGASFTPSPVIATIWPCSLSSRTMSCLCLGSARENTHPPGDISTRICSARSMALNSRPVKLLPSASLTAAKMPMSVQIASAVSLLSPVITTTLMPAVLHASMAPRTSGRGGSRSPAKPTKVRSLSMAMYWVWSIIITCAACCSVPSYVARVLREAPDLTAKPRQRSALVDIWDTVARISARSLSVRGTTPSGSWTEVQRSSTHSGAPFTSSLLPPEGAGVVARRGRPPAGAAASSLTTTLMLLRPRSNSRVASLTYPPLMAEETPWHPLEGSERLRSAMEDMTSSDSTPIFSASTLSAPSVGSPAHLYRPSSLSSITASLHSTHTCATMATQVSSAPAGMPTMPPSLGS
mmetsp:Transcript_8292/g.20948  ORF Transcript_8292/g.20948 Transcript_8292/m.20948 type:complete len:394 (+) Transcript_8292:1225-2406(+)